MNTGLFETKKIIANTIKGLAEAFNQLYWSMANVTYKEEIAMGAIEEMKLKGAEAHAFLRQCGLPKKDYPIIHYWIDGLVEESMGMFIGITPEGDEKMKKLLGYY